MCLTRADGPFYKYERSREFSVFSSLSQLLVIARMSTTVVSLYLLLVAATSSLPSSLTGNISIFRCRLLLVVQIFMIFFLEMHAARV